MDKFTEFELNTIDKGWKYYHKNKKYDKGIIKNIRVCIYLRKSTEDVKDNSLKLQLNEINKFINSINTIYQDKFNFYYTSDDIYKEDNVSGMQGRMRKEFNKMLSFIESNAGYYGVCIVYKMDRFSRKLEDTLKYISLLKSFKCVLKALDFDDFGDPTSDLLRNMLGVVAQYHAQNSALTSIKGTLKKVEEHKAVGILPMGLIQEKTLNQDVNYKGASKIVIDTDKARIIKIIFNMYSNGYSMNYIANYLKENGLKNNEGHDISRQQINYILKNKRYNGTYIYADPKNIRKRKYDNGVKKPDYYEYKNAFPKIIDDELFNKVQDILSIKKNIKEHISSKEDYLLSGIIYCNKCCKKLNGWSRPKYKGKRYYDYVCSNRKNKKVNCNTKNINKVYIDKLITSIVKKIINNILDIDDNYIIKIINKKINFINEEVKLLNNEISKRKLKINKLVNLLLDDSLNDSIYQDKLNEQNKEIILLNDKLDKLRSGAKEDLEEILIKFKNYDVNELDNDNTLLKLLIFNIFDKISIDNNYLYLNFYNISL